jgi:hypothetical protein
VFDPLSLDFTGNWASIPNDLNFRFAIFIDWHIWLWIHIFVSWTIFICLSCTIFICWSCNIFIGWSCNIFIGWTGFTSCSRLRCSHNFIEQCIKTIYIKFFISSMFIKPLFSCFSWLCYDMLLIICHRFKLSKCNSKRWISLILFY